MEYVHVVQMLGVCMYGVVLKTWEGHIDGVAPASRINPAVIPTCDARLFLH